MVIKTEVVHMTQGAAILKKSVSALLAYYMLKSSFLIKSYETSEAPGEAFRAKFCLKSCFLVGRFLGETPINGKY